MHGIIFFELQNYVGDRLGRTAWQTLLAEAGLAGKNYLAFNEYPDEDIVALVGTAARITKQDAGDILEDFGEFIAPALVRRYGALLRPEWRTLDVLEHAESTIHTSVRLWNTDATPPRLRCRRTSPTEVVISYDSPRRLCRLARGLGQGIGAAFDEEIAVSESACMLEGDDACELTFTLTPVASQVPEDVVRA